MFSITGDPIDVENEMKRISDLSIGAIVSFEGRVRNHNDGREVVALDYEIYHEMAISEGQKIVNQAMEQFDIKKIFCIHRYGNLKLGDIAVLVVACSHHRAEAFECCEFVIDKVKETVPIWKKEHYLSHPSQWVACHRCSGENHA